MVLRKLNTKIPTMDDLKLAPVFNKIIAEKNGLVFVTGATGSGKTTTLAAMLNGLNEEHAMHIVTLEDPVEFMHPHKAATFCQREMGKDFSSFALGLRAALRQAPKVILVGEIRDRETMEIALTAAETGHTVFPRCTRSAPRSPSTACSACSARRRNRRCASASPRRCAGS